jgi:23S rRNA pseudouridine1911/1915/1917 synthase
LSTGDTGPVPTLRFVAGDELAGQRVDAALAILAGVSRSQARHWIDAGAVTLAGAAVLRANRKVVAGDVIEATPPAPVDTSVVPEDIPLDVLHEDRDLIVIDKASGMVVHPAPGHYTGTLVNALLHHCGDLAGVGGVVRPGIVHRLDRGTSGVMVAAKHDEAHRLLAEQFHDHTIERIYLTLVRGVPGQDEGRIDRPIGRHPRDRKRMSVRTRSGRAAATRWRVLERFVDPGFSYLEIRPETGRTHQIRVHLASAGLPIAGDDVYGRARRHSPHLAGLERPALHAAVLGFVHPASGERMRFEAPPPDDMQRVLAALRGTPSPSGADAGGCA